MDIIKRETIVETCFACPSQWEAKTTDNGDVLIYVRHGILTLDIDDERVLTGHPEGVDGVMNEEEMIEFVNNNASRVKIV